MKKNRFTAIAGIIAGLSLMAGNVAFSAVPDGGFTFGPSTPDIKIPEIMHFELRPGDTVTEYVTAKNYDTVPDTFSTYPADTMYNKALHIVYKGKNDPRSLASAWITMDEKEFVLQPNEEKKIAFTLTVPKDAGISDLYKAGITLEKTEKDPGKSMLKFKSALVIPVELKVTMNPEHVAKYGEVDIFKTSPVLWVSVALFLASMGYFIYGQRKEKLAKAKQNTSL